MNTRFIFRWHYHCALFILFGTMFGLADKADAGIIHFTTPDQLYLNEGDRHEWLGFAEGSDGSGVIGFKQSGVLIHPNFVIASVHGLLDVDSDRSSIFSNLQFGFGSNYFNDRQQVQSVSEVFLHPSYQNLEVGDDLALLYFDNPFSNITPAERFRGDISTLQGVDAYTAGFGITGNNLTGPVTQDGNKRGGVNARLDPIAGGFSTPNFQTTIFRPDTDLFFSRELGIGFSEGMSGGFWGIEENGSLLLTGVNSLKYGDGTYFTTNVASTLDNDWIDSVIESKVSTVPEPGTSFMLGIASMALAFHRKRRAR